MEAIPSQVAGSFAGTIIIGKMISRLPIAVGRKIAMTLENARLPLVLFCAGLLGASCESATQPSALDVAEGFIAATDLTISYRRVPTIHVKQDMDELCGFIFVLTPGTQIR